MSVKKNRVNVALNMIYQQRWIRANLKCLRMYYHALLRWTILCIMINVLKHFIYVGCIVETCNFKLPELVGRASVSFNLTRLNLQQEINKKSWLTPESWKSELCRKKEVQRLITMDLRLHGPEKYGFLGPVFRWPLPLFSRLLCNLLMPYCHKTRQGGG